MSELARYDGVTADRLAGILGLPRVVLYDEVGSTMDEAHMVAAAGAVAGTLLLAESQTRGRGRGGRQWTSEPGSGVWATLVERPQDAAAVEVLSLRLGLRLARALQRFADAPIGVKWPNDLHVGDRKLAGILIEARWRDARPEWVAIGVGINLRVPPGVPGATSLGAGTSRLEVLGEAIPALRAGAMQRGPLDAEELTEWSRRDWARGRRARSPRSGTVLGVTSRGELVVQTETGTEHCPSGSLVLEGVDS